MIRQTRQSFQRTQQPSKCNCMVLESNHWILINSVSDRITSGEDAPAEIDTKQHDGETVVVS